MAREKRFDNDEERHQAMMFTADVIKEIKKNSGLSYVEIANRLMHYDIEIGDDLLRQYGCGTKSIGPQRLINIVKAACQEKWAGDKCIDVLVYSDHKQLQNLKSLEVDFEQYRILLVKRLMLSAEELALSGVSAARIRQMVDEALLQAEEKLSRT